MTKCWFNLSHKSLHEFIYFVCLLSPPQGHYRSSAETSKGSLCVWLSGESYLMIRFRHLTLKFFSFASSLCFQSTDSFKYFHMTDLITVGLRWQTTLRDIHFETQASGGKEFWAFTSHEVDLLTQLLNKYLLCQKYSRSPFFFTTATIYI